MKIKNENKFFNFFINIFINLKGHSLKFSFFKNICNIIEMINYVIVIDIIFNYKRDFINYLSILYFINPIIYIELLNIYLIKLKIKKNQNLSIIELEKNIYKKDQISLLVKKFFKLTLYDQIYYNDYILLKIIIIVLTYIIYYILVIKNNCNIIIIIKKVFSYLLYFIYKPCLVLILNIFCQKIFFLYITKSSIKFKIFLDFFLFFLILFPIIFFYKYFIYAFYKNEKHYFFKSNLFIFEFSINIFNSLFIILRLKIIFSFTLQFIWIILFLYKFKIKLNSFKYNIYREFEDFLEIFLEIFCVIYLIIKFIFLFLIKNNKKINHFKIIEIIILFFLLFIFFYFITYNSKYVITFSNLNDFFFKKNIKFNYGLYQLFYLFINFVFYQDINDKERILVINNLKKIINKFIINKLDYNLIDKNIVFLFDSNKEESINKKNVNFEDNFFEFFLTLIKKYYKKYKKIKNIYFNDFLFFNKIIIYCFFQLNCYQLLFLKNKFFYTNYNKKDIVLLSYIYFLYFQLLKYQYSKKIDFSLDYILIYLKINSKYLKFINSFEHIIYNFSRDFPHLHEIINEEKKLIQENKKKLLFLNNLSKKILSNKNNYEIEKINYIDNLLFNDNFITENEYFDLINIKTILDNNNFFILKFNSQNFIIKKVPLNFYENTHISSSDLKNKLFLSLFPKELGTIIHKEIKKIILYKNYNKINTIIKNYNNTISLINLTFVILPILKDNLYIYCKINFLENQLGNCLLIDKLGYIKYFGEFFHNIFGFQYFNKFETNILNILNLNNIKLDDIKFEKEFKINFPKMLKKIKKNLKKSGVTDNKIENNLNLVQKQFFNKKLIKIKLEVKKIYYIQKTKLYLIIINFIDLNFSFFTKNNQNSFKNLTTIEKLSYENNEKNKTNLITHNSNLFENKWFLQNNTNKKILQKILELISFIYNFLLILFAIIFSLYLKKKIKNFISYKDEIYVNRIFNMEFLYLNFYFLQTIVIEDDEYLNFNYYDYFTDFFNLNQIDINLIDFYNFHEQDEIIYIINYYNNDFQNNIEVIKKNSPLYKKQRELIYHYDLLGNIITNNYLNIFPVILSYHFTLSQKFDYLKIPIIDINNILNYKSLNNNQKLCYNVIKNFFPISNRMEEINELIEDYYMDSLQKLKKLILIIMTVFILINFFSIILLFFNINIINNKIENIVINIQNITDERLNLLKNKILFCKQLLKNEIHNFFIKNESNNNQNSIIKPLENNANQYLKLLKTFNSTKKKNKINSTNSNPSYINQNLNNFHCINDNDILLLNNIIDNNNLKNFDFNKNQNHKKIIFSHFNRNKILFITLTFYIIIFLSIFISAIPIILNKINKIYYQLIYLREIDNLQDNSILYFISIKYNILLNLTEEKNNLTQIKDNILINFQKFFFDISNEPFYSEVLNLINTKLSCDNFIFFQGDYTNDFIQICHLFKINNISYYVIINGLINILTEIYLKFLKSKRNKEDIINYYHNYQFQYITFIYIINILDGLSVIYYNYLYPCFYNRIDFLSNFIFIIFLILVIIEIIYYYISNFFILRENTNSVIIYLIIEKFFIEKKNNKN